MNKLLSCRFNMDTNRVEARFEDGTTCHRLHRRGGRVRQHPAQRAELDWLLCNRPLEYAQLVLEERWSTISLGCDHGRLED